MISLTIIFAAVVLALIYALAWLFVPGVRQQIEQPKHRFQHRLRQYDRDCRMGAHPAAVKAAGAAGAAAAGGAAAATSGAGAAGIAGTAGTAGTAGAADAD